MPFDPNMLPGGFGYGQPDPSQLGWLWNAQASGQLPSSFPSAEYAPAGGSSNLVYGTPIDPSAEEASKAIASRMARRMQRPGAAPSGPPDASFGSLAPDMSVDVARRSLHNNPTAGLDVSPILGPRNSMVDKTDYGPMPPAVPPYPGDGPYAPLGGDTPPPERGGQAPSWISPEMLANYPGAGPNTPNLLALPAPMEGQVAPRTPTIPLADTRPLTPPAPRASLSGAAPTGSLLDRIGNGINNNADLLLAMGAGFAGAGSFGEGMHRAFTNAAPLAGKNQTVDALVARGLPVDIARAAAANPAIMQQLLPQIFGAKQLQSVKIKGALGEEIPLVFDPAQGRYLTPDGKPYGENAEGNASFGSLLAPGVKFDANLAGEDYLNQFSPEVKGAVKAYFAGDVMPSGNPRMQSIGNYAKMIAQKIGPDLGIEASDAKYAERKTMRDRLAKSEPSTLGGQITFAGTSLAHLADVAEKAVALDNSNGLGVAPVAKLINMSRQLSTDQAAKANGVSGAVTHYGQEITKFYAGAPGGQEERMRFLKTMDTAKSSSEIADAIRTERDLIPGRLEQLRGQITDTLGAEEANRRLARAGVEKTVEKINHSLARLDPNGPEARLMAGQAVPAQSAAGAAPAAAAAPQAPGKYVYDPATGTMKAVQ